MKRTTPESVTVNDTVFYIFPFSAFTAANLSGEVIALIGPVVGSFLPLAGKGKGNAQNIDPETRTERGRGSPWMQRMSCSAGTHRGFLSLRSTLSR